MKKALILFLTIIFTLPVLPQDKNAVSSDKNVLKANALSLFLATGSVFYEHKISDMTSAQLGFGYAGLNYNHTRFSGIILTPEVRIYPKKEAIDGFYIAPYLRYQNFSLKSGSDEASLGSMGGGLLLGRQWITNSGFTMDLFFGGHYSSHNLKLKSGSDSFDTNLITGFGMRIGFALGFAF